MKKFIGRPGGSGSAFDPANIKNQVNGSEVDFFAQSRFLSLREAALAFVKYLISLKYNTLKSNVCNFCEGL